MKITFAIALSLFVMFGLIFSYVDNVMEIQKLGIKINENELLLLEIRKEVLQSEKINNQLDNGVYSETMYRVKTNE